MLPVPLQEKPAYNKEAKFVPVDPKLKDQYMREMGSFHQFCSHVYVHSEISAIISEGVAIELAMKYITRSTKNCHLITSIHIHQSMWPKGTWREVVCSPPDLETYTKQVFLFPLSSAPTTHSHCTYTNSNIPSNLQHYMNTSMQVLQ